MIYKKKARQNIICSFGGRLSVSIRMSNDSKITFRQKLNYLNTISIFTGGSFVVFLFYFYFLFLIAMCRFIYLYKRGLKMRKLNIRESESCSNMCGPILAVTLVYFPARFSLLCAKFLSIHNSLLVYFHCCAYYIFA